MRKRAVDDGASVAELEKVDDAESLRDALIELVLTLQSKRPVTRQPKRKRKQQQKARKPSQARGWVPPDAVLHAVETIEESTHQVVTAMELERKSRLARKKHIARKTLLDLLTERGAIGDPAGMTERRTLLDLL